MGCVPSKLFRKDLKQEEIVFGNGTDSTHRHVVSLTSSTYGVLNLEKKQPIIVKDEFLGDFKRKKLPIREEPTTEVINAWELMEGLEEEEAPPVSIRRSPKPMVFLRGFGDLDTKRSPLKFLNHVAASPKKLMRSGGGGGGGGGGGKENNRGLVNRFKWDYSSPKGSSKSRTLVENSMKSDRYSVDSGGISRRSLRPLFDPELLESLEKELSVEEEAQTKKMVFSTPISRNKRISSTKDCGVILDSFEKKILNRCENAVVIYTTTLRGIRKTFEDCNTVRSIVESHGVQVLERDVSMDSGFKEELRGIIGKKEVKVPVVFVKGRLIGGAEEVVKLEEEGKLGILLDGIPRAAAVGCPGCAGIRFVMCLECSGSCKVVGEDGRKTVKCGECNENGLIRCPICCLF